MGCCISTNKKKDPTLASNRSLSKDPSLRQTTLKDRELTLAVVGLDNAGKTVTAKVLEGAPTTEVAPTIGFNNLTFKFNERGLTLYDLGGGAKIRAIWHNYFSEVHGIIFVVDSSSRERVVECKEALEQTLADTRVCGKPLLVFANKQDVKGALDDSELCNILSLDSIVTKHNSHYKVVCCSALNAATANGKGGSETNKIKAGLTWLIDSVDEIWAVLSVRVEHDVREQREKEEREKKERLERVRRIREEREREEEGDDSKVRASKDDDKPSGDPFKPIDTAVLYNTNKNNKSVVTKSTSKDLNSAAKPPAKNIHVQQNSDLFSTKQNQDAENSTDDAKKSKTRRNQVSPIPIVLATDEDVVTVMRNYDDVVVGRAKLSSRSERKYEREEDLDSDNEGWSVAEVRRHSPDGSRHNNDIRDSKRRKNIIADDSDDGSSSRRSNQPSTVRSIRRPNSEVTEIST